MVQEEWATENGRVYRLLVHALQMEELTTPPMEPSIVEAWRHGLRWALHNALMNKEVFEK